MRAPFFLAVPRGANSCRCTSYCEGCATRLAFTGTTRFEPGNRDGFVRLRACMVERSQYSVCLAGLAEIPLLRFGRLAADRSGFLAPNGELMLELPAD